MTAKNDVTGDLIASKKSSEAYRDGWDRIFGNKKTQPEHYRRCDLGHDLGTEEYCAKCMQDNPSP